MDTSIPCHNFGRLQFSPSRCHSFIRLAAFGVRSLGGDFVAPSSPAALRSRRRRAAQLAHVAKPGWPAVAVWPAFPFFCNEPTFARTVADAGPFAMLPAESSGAADSARAGSRLGDSTGRKQTG